MAPQLPDSRELRGQVRQFLATQEFEPACDAWLGGFSPEFSKALAAQGWVGMTWPRHYGGHDRTVMQRHAVIEELLAAGAPVAAHWISDRQTGPLLLRYASEELKLRLLPAMARGECYFSIGMSEPDSGSDLASVKMSARKVDGGWLVTGTKVWTSHAHHSHYMLALLRTSPSESKHNGLSQLIVDLKAPGVEIHGIRLLSGAQHFNEVVLHDAFVPDLMLVGEEGQGWRQVISELAFERSGPERFLSTYQLFAQVVKDFGAEQNERAASGVGRLVARLLALRQMSLGVATLIEGGATPVVEASLVKDLGTRFEQEVIEEVRAFGASGERFRDLLVQAVLSGPGFTLRGGTTEILRGIVARGLVGR